MKQGSKYVPVNNENEELHTLREDHWVTLWEGVTESHFERVSQSHTLRECHSTFALPFALLMKQESWYVPENIIITWEIRSS